MKKRGAAGVTLLELTAVISISAVVAALVFSSWNYINKHVFYYENRGNIRNETSRVAEELTLKLRRTPGVLGFTPNSIKLLEQDSGDTLEYTFDGNHLTKNGNPIHFGVQGGSITSFNLRNMAADNSEYLLLEVTVSSADARNNHDTCRVIVNAKTIGEDYQNLMVGF